jgi:hypothetical protein
VGQADTLLAAAADLERRDGEVAATLETVADLSRRAAEIREQGAALLGLLEAAPGEIAELDRRGAAAGDAAAEAATALDAAERHLRELDARPAGDERRVVAERELQAVRELAADAAARKERLAGEREQLIESAAAAREEAAALTERARRVADALQAVPRVSQSGREAPGKDLAQLDEWASRVQAALFVVRGQLEGERDRLVREANELGSVALGEQVAGSSVALVRRRLEEALDA